MFYIDQLRTLSSPVGLVKTGPGFIDRFREMNVGGSCDKS